MLEILMFRTPLSMDPLIWLMFSILCTANLTSSSSSPPSNINPFISNTTLMPRVVVTSLGGINLTCSSAYEVLYSACENTSYLNDTILQRCCNQLSTSFSTIPNCYCQFIGEGLIMNASSFYSDTADLCGLSIPRSVSACLFETSGKHHI